MSGCPNWSLHEVCGVGVSRETSQGNQIFFQLFSTLHFFIAKEQQTSKQNESLGTIWILRFVQALFDCFNTLKIEQHPLPFEALLRQIGTWCGHSSLLLSQQCGVLLPEIHIHLLPRISRILFASMQPHLPKQ